MNIQKPSRRTVLIASGVVVLGIALWLVTLVPGWLAGEPDADQAQTADAGDASRRIQATLFYVSEDGSGLVSLSREVPYGATPAEQAKQIVSVLVQAPPSGHASAIPPGATVRAVFVGGKGEAYVDLGLEAATARVRGSLDEALAVYAIVNSITLNLPDIKAVQILVDGKEVDTLAGHLDLREPITRSDAWVRKGQ